MKRVGILLHETSIINFPFMWKLVKRYFFYLIIVPLLVFSVFLYKYVNQREIYYVSIGFNSISTSENTPVNVLSALSDKKADGLAPEEVVAIINNVDFKYRLAEKLMAHEDFKKINFNSLGDKNELKTFAGIFGRCNNDKDCMKKVLVGIISEFMSISPDKNVYTRFNLTIRNLELNSAELLAKLVAEVIEVERIESLRKRITQQVNMSEELIKQKKEELAKVGIENIIDEMKQNELELENIQRQLTTYQRDFLSIQKKLTDAKTVINQTQKTFDKNLDSRRLSQSQKAKTLKDSIDKLREDIASLTTANNSLSVKDTGILDQLNFELKNKEREYKKIIKKTRGISSIDVLIEKKDQDVGYDAFNYEVLKNQYDEAKSNFEVEKAKKEIAVEKNQKLKAIYEQHKPSVEYLKLLLEKTMKLRLATTTVVSDLAFDSKITSSGKFKRLGKGRMILASSAISAFISFVLIVLTFLFDNRIYDEEELSSNFEGLSVIGNTPDFE